MTVQVGCDVLLPHTNRDALHKTVSAITFSTEFAVSVHAHATMRMVHEWPFEPVNDLR